MDKSLSWTTTRIKVSMFWLLLKKLSLEVTMLPSSWFCYADNSFSSKPYYDSVDKKNQLDVTFCILYFSSNGCSTCFGQPIIRSWRLCDVIALCWYVPWLQEGGQVRLAGSASMDALLDVTFCILYFSSNGCSTCFGQPCAHHQELTTVWCYSLVLVCAVAAGRWSSPVGR